MQNRGGGPGDLFAELGETLFWLSALTDHHDLQAEPLLSGMKWARNRVTHGVIVSAPVRYSPGGFFVGPGGSEVGPGGGTIGPGTHRWLPAEDFPVDPDEQPAPKQLADYRSRVAGRPVVHSLRTALGLARGEAP